MRVLWVVNFALPELTGREVQESTFGGWVGAMLRQLNNEPNLSIGLAMKSRGERLSSGIVDGVTCYWIPQHQRDQYDISQEDCEKVLGEFAPDILHLEGSEQAFSKRFITAWKGKNVLSLQGILNGYDQYEYGGLKVSRLVFSRSIAAAMFGLSMWANYWIRFWPRLRVERATLREAKNFLGRTGWDRAHSYHQNRFAEYYSCNRILRKVFYEERWNIDAKQPFRIFVGNSASPRKGFHYVLEAISILKSQYPRIRVAVAGDAPYPSSGRDWKRRIGYAAYLRHLLSKLELSENVEFLGRLSAEDVAKQMCASHVFVLPSVIENSPNTLGEAMALGVPCVAAFSGGVSDMAADGSEALLYRATDSVQLAYQVKRIFDDAELQSRLSETGRTRAMETHDPQANAARLISAYEQIAGAHIQRGKEPN